MKIPAKLLEAYFCSGDPLWPLNLSTEEENELFKGSVIIAHYLICSDMNGLPSDYREEMIGTFLKLGSNMHLKIANSTETTQCLLQKLPCLVYENVCGSNKIWNFRNALSFIRQNLPNADTSSLLKFIHSAINVLLEGENVEMSLSAVSPYCPDSSEYCKLETGVRNKRELSSEKTIQNDLEFIVNLKRRKRAFGGERSRRVRRRRTRQKEEKEENRG